MFGLLLLLVGVARAQVPAGPGYIGGGAGSGASGAAASCSGDINGACSQVTGLTHASGAVANGVTGTTQSAGDNSTKLATTGYVDAAAAALNPALSALDATTGVLPNTPAYLNGAAGIGATLISTSFGALTIDGITAAVGDIVLVKNQASSFQNGLYTVTATGSGAAFYTLTRALDFDTSSDMLIGTVIAVGTGTSNGGTSWRLSTKVTTVGTDAVTFAQFTYALANTLNTQTAPFAGTLTAGSGRYLKGDGTNYNQSSGSASGTGACAGSNWASTLNSDAAPTCTQPAFTDISSTVGAAQLSAQSSVANFYRTVVATSAIATSTANNGTVFEGALGGSTSTATESVAATILPIIGKFLKMSCKVGVAPGTSNSYLFNLRLSGTGNVGTPGNVACTIATAATSCTDTTNTYTTVSANALMDVEITTTVGGSAPTASPGLCTFEFDI